MISMWVVFGLCGVIFILMLFNIVTEILRDFIGREIDDAIKRRIPKDFRIY